jgi:hypothetical protein
MAIPRGGNSNSNVRAGGGNRVQTTTIAQAIANQNNSLSLNGLAQSIQQPYIQKGLTYKSNNKFVMQRDGGGNIILDPTPANMQNLIIEPTIENITNRSFVEVSNTQFNYFKFPAKSTSDNSNFGFDQLNVDIDLENDPTAEFNTRYVTPVEMDQNDQPVTWKRICIGATTTKIPSPGNATPIKWFDSSTTQIWQEAWFAVGTVKPETTAAELTDDGFKLRQGWQRVPFTKALKGLDQLESGTYTLTPEMIIALRENNKTLKFDIKIMCYVTSQGGFYGTSPDETAAFGQGVYYGMVLSRGMPGFWRSNRSMSPGGQQVFDTTCPPNQIEYHAATNASQSTYTSLTMEYIVDIDEAYDYDKWYIQLCAHYKSYYLADNCYWDITVIDDPGAGNYGVQ